MAQKHNEKGGNGVNKGVVVGGLATLAAAAAGAYFLYGTEAGKKKRKQMKSWMLRVKADVLERMENLKEINEEVYNKIVEEVAEKYKAVKEISPEELAGLASFLRSQWKNIKKSMGVKKSQGGKARGGGAKKTKKSSK